jgi:hypothetical protein
MISKSLRKPWRNPRFVNIVETFVQVLFLSFAVAAIQAVFIGSDGDYRPFVPKLEQTTVILRDIPSATSSDLIIGIFRYRAFVHCCIH